MVPDRQETAGASRVGSGSSVDGERPHPDDAADGDGTGSSLQTENPQPKGRRPELAEAAYRMIAERGVEGLSLRAVARELGATTGLVTHHFIDRAELIDAALAHAARVMVRRIERAVGPDATAADVLAAVLPTDGEALENWRFTLSVRAAALSDPAFRRYDETIAAHWASFLPDELRPTLGDAADDTADQLVAVLDGLSLRAAVDPDAWPPERQRRLLDLAWRSLGSPGPADSAPSSGASRPGCELDNPPDPTVNTRRP